MTRYLPLVTSRSARLNLVLVILSTFLAACAQKTSVQLATAKLSPGWSVQIVDVSEPEEAMVMRGQGLMGPPIGAPGRPLDQNKKWLVVKVRVTPPRAQPKAESTPQPSNPKIPNGVPGGIDSQTIPNAANSDDSPTMFGSLTLAEIKLVSPSEESFSAEALATGGMWKDKSGAEIREFQDPSGTQQLIKDSAGRVQMVLGYGKLNFFRAEPQELILLFAVPNRAPTLSFRL